MTTNEKETWISFQEVVTKFLDNVKDPYYEHIVTNMMDNFKNLGCLMILKVYFLHN